MLKLTYNLLWKIKLLPDEKKGLEEVLSYANKRWYELYLFWSRLNWFGADIDLAIKGEGISFREIIDLQTIFALFSDTKLDVVEYEKVKELLNV